MVIPNQQLFYNIMVCVEAGFQPDANCGAKREKIQTTDPNLSAGNLSDFARWDQNLKPHQNHAKLLFYFLGGVVTCGYCIYK